MILKSSARRRAMIFEEQRPSARDDIEEQRPSARDDRGGKFLQSMEHHIRKEELGER